MIENSVENLTSPTMAIAGEKGESLILKGLWTLRGLTMNPDLGKEASTYASRNLAWDLSTVESMDSAGALVLWQAWGETLPKQLILRPEQERLFLRLQSHPIPTAPLQPEPSPLLLRVTRSLKDFGIQLMTWIALLGQLILDFLHLFRHPPEIPWKEISATIHETGGRALGITALVGFLIGIVVSYLSSLQLRTFGASVYIVNILGLSIIRELGPLLAAILVAGRSGSAMTASLGVMRVTQELDALEAMGISHSLRLILPKVVALVIAMPLLVVWTDFVALIGGALAARMELEISMHQFMLKLPSAVPVSNFFIGMGKGAVFGLFIALIACHFGLRIKPDTQSLGNETTNSVVVSITLVILLDAVFAIVFKGVGI